MSHIKGKDEILRLRSYVKDLENDDISIELLRDIMNSLTPKNKNGKSLVGLRIKEKGLESAAYIPQLNLITISKNKFKKVVDESAVTLVDETKIDKISRIKAYYKLFALLHETEHSYQFLIAKNKIPFKYQEIVEGYQNIINSVMKQDTIVPRPIKNAKHIYARVKYEKNPYDYILERNASVEAAHDISLIADSENEKDISEVFNLLDLSMEYIGYDKDCKGCMYKTHLDLGLKSKYNKITHDVYDEDERMRYGLEVDNETRKKLLVKVRKNRFEVL